ncbi:hypothetical protein XENOCAPTIV_005286 [Xenoophorus captivus]|uniref:Transmembrane protein n=1 Tax=Xenoophorus captivus TaxID=1517983 RepID=A0ABV0RFP0_9TELE
MTTNSTLSEPVQVNTVEFYALLCGWFCYCHTGAWTVSQPLRFLVALQGYAKLLFGHFWVRRWEVALSLFASYLLGRVKIDWKRSLMVLLWLCVDTTALALEILLSGPHATRRAPAKIATAAMEALLAFAVIIYLGQLTLSLKGQGKWIWLSKLVGLAVWSLGWGTRYKVVWTSAFGAAPHTFRIKRERGGLYLPIINYIWQDPQDGFWLPALHLLDGRALAIGTHGSPDSPPRVTDVQGCQVSTTIAECGTQTSVTTNNVTCQTSAGDNEEQHQPVSLGKLVSPIPPTEDPMREDAGPPRLADGWLNEVMLTIPPQTFSPPSPLPPILSPILSPIGTTSQEESVAHESPSPPVLRRELRSSPLRMHPDFIDEFEILDVWSPTPVPQSPHYSDHLENEVLSLCVYDPDLDFF